MRLIDKRTVIGYKKSIPERLSGSKIRMGQSAPVCVHILRIDYLNVKLQRIWGHPDYIFPARQCHIPQFLTLKNYKILSVVKVRWLNTEVNMPWSDKAAVIKWERSRHFSNNKILSFNIWNVSLYNFFWFSPNTILKWFENHLVLFLFTRYKVSQLIGKSSLYN